MTASLLCGILLAGVFGLGLFAHPAASQLYFWQNAQPVFAIVLAWAGVLGVRTYGLRFIVAAVVVFLGLKVVERTGLGLVPQTAALVAAAAVAIVVLILLRHWHPRSIAGWRPRILRRWRPWIEPSKRNRLAAIVLSLAFIAVLTQASQSVSIPAGIAGGSVAKASATDAIDASQLAAYAFIRDHSGTNDRVITNKHCLHGTGDTCDARWFAIAAFAERPVLVEGWAYTQRGSTPGFIRKYLDLEDRFFASPTAAAKRSLQALDVRYVYVDKRDPYAGKKLAQVADLVFSSKWAAVYSLG
jgi:hypothetical protein